MAQGPEPGWYDDPEHAGKQRYWDGDRWTDARRDHSAYLPTRTSQTRSATKPSAAAAGGSGVCPHCGASGVSKARGLQGIEVLIAVVLFFVTFMIGAVVYYVWVESIPYCNSCGHRVRGGALTA